MPPMPPIPAIPGSSPPPASSTLASSSCTLPLGSISIALRFEKPSIKRASLPNFWLNASLRLCAGSVEMSSTERRTFASWMAREHDVVVFPTPPLPPTKIHRSVRWSRMAWSVGSSGESSALTTADIFWALGFVVLESKGDVE